MPPRPHSTGERRARLLIAAITACFGAYLLAYFFTVLDIENVIRTALVSDIQAYEAIGSEILDGHLPYLDMAVEHLPVSVLAIVGLSWLANLIGVGLELVWVPVMAAVFIVSVTVIDSVDHEEPAGFRYLAVATPLLPLVLFRLEPLVILLTAVAIAAYAARRYATGGVWTAIGVLAKGWPITLVAYPWKSGRRWIAASVVAVSGIVLMGVGGSAGFREARSFDGIHSETIVGNLVLVWRHLTSTALDSVGAAGAVYVTVPNWALFANMIPGILILIVAIVVVATRGTTFRQLTVTVGLSVLGIMLMSPLFSTQFIFWLVPFVAFATIDIRRLYVVTAFIGLAIVTIFEPHSFIWALEVLAKNVAIVWLAIVWIRTVLAFPRLQPKSTSRRNLPV